MRLLPFIVLAAGICAALPVPARALQPAQGQPLAREFNPAGVSDVADKLLWCGHALIEASPQAAASGDTAGAAAMVRDGNTLIGKGTGLLTGAGFDPCRMTATNAGYAVRLVKIELAGAGSHARYGYDECLVRLSAGSAVSGFRHLLRLRAPSR